MFVCAIFIKYFSIGSTNLLLEFNETNHGQYAQVQIASLNQGKHNEIRSSTVGIKYSKKNSDSDDTCQSDKAHNFFSKVA